MVIKYREDIELYEALHEYFTPTGDTYKPMRYEGYGNTATEALMHCLSSIMSWNGQEIREEMGYDEHERPDGVIAIVA